MMFWKEWRESLRTLPIAMFVVALVAYAQMPNRTNYVTGLAKDFTTAMALWGSIYALTLALLQTWSEQRTDVRGWLLSRPVRRENVYWAKTIAAFSVYMLAFIIPWAACYWWLGRVAPSTRPADRQMLVPGLLTYLAAFAFHPSTIWMMSRQARWVGSKMVVLILPITTTFVASQVLTEPTNSIQLMIVIAISLFCLWAYPTIARDAYVRKTNQPTGVAGSSKVTWLSTLGEFTAVVAFGFCVLGVAASLLTQFFEPVRDGTVAGQRFTPEGDIAVTRERYQWDPKAGNSDYQVVEASVLPPFESDVPVESDRQTAMSPDQYEKLVKPSAMVNLVHTAPINPFRKLRPYQYSERYGGLMWLYHDDGYYLAYSEPNSVPSDTPLLATTLDASGFASTDARFVSDHPISNFRNAMGNRWVITSPTRFGLTDRRGIYEASLDDRSIRTVLEMQIDELGLLAELCNFGPTAVVISENQIHLFSIESNDPNMTIPKPVGERNMTLGDAMAAWPPIRLVPRQTIPLPDDWFPFQEQPRSSAWATHFIIDLGDEGFQLTQTRHADIAKTLRFDGSGKITQRLKYQLPKLDALTPPVISCMAILPPTVNAIAGVSLLVPQRGMRNPVANPGTITAIIVIGCLLHAILAWFLTRLACRTRSCKQQATRRWYWCSLITGVITPLIVLCLYPKVATETCVHCNGSIRVDANRCPHCDANWESPASIGIEVFARS